MAAWQWLVLAGMAISGLWLLYVYSPLRWVLAGFAVMLAVQIYFGRRYQKRLEEERKGESICTFARALPAREHDTWAARAVYEELSRLARVPVRPMDDLRKDLQIDPDDLDDVAFEIARRAGRSMKDTQKNPLFDHVVTVADMVAFFENQVKEANQPAQTTPRGCAPRRV